jgi:hypothetical protein
MAAHGAGDFPTLNAEIGQFAIAEGLQRILRATEIEFAPNSGDDPRDEHDFFLVLRANASRLQGVARVTLR